MVVLGGHNPGGGGVGGHSLMTAIWGGSQIGDVFLFKELIRRCLDRRQGLWRGLAAC